MKYSCSWLTKMDTPEIQAIEAYISSLKVSQHHLDTYNHLVLYELPELIHNLVTQIELSETVQKIVPNTEAKCKVEILFTNVHMGKASFIENGRRCILYPEECRKKELYYCAPVYATVIQKRTSSTGAVTCTVINKAIICDMPVMVGSILCNLKTAPVSERAKECPKDVGGYFIVNGIERVLVTSFQEPKEGEGSGSHNEEPHCYVRNIFNSLSPLT